jgi:hypothetical protein
MHKNVVSITRQGVLSIKKTSAPLCQEGRAQAGREASAFSGLHDLREHVLEQNFNGHRMGAVAVRHKELTIAVKNTVVKTDMMFVIIAMKGNFKGGKAEALAFLGIAPGFLSFADHAIVHFYSPFRVRGKQKRHANRRMPFS